jgi:hypothetical protein
MQVRIIGIAIIFALSQLSGPGTPKQRNSGPKSAAVKIRPIRSIRTIRGSTTEPLYPPEIDMPRPLFFHPTFVATGTVLVTPEAEDAPRP